VSLSQFINRPCTLKRASSNATANAYGDEATTYTDVSTVCELQGHLSDEQGEGDISGSTRRAFFLPDENMGSKPSLNRLVLDGVTWEFVSRPDHVWDPLQGVYDHWAAEVKATE